MIGKMSDMVTAAVVVSATENKNLRQEPQAKAPVKAQEPVTSDAEQVVVKDSQGTSNIAVEKNDEAAKNKNEEQKNSENDKLNEKFVSEMTKELNELMSKLNCDLEFKYHQEVGVMSVKMVDKNTKEVLKEYPPEEMVEGMIKAQEWIGAFLDKNA